MMTYATGDQSDPGSNLGRLPGEEWGGALVLRPEGCLGIEWVKRGGRDRAHQA